MHSTILSFPKHLILAWWNVRPGSSFLGLQGLLPLSLASIEGLFSQDFSYLFYTYRKKRTSKENKHHRAL